MESAISKKKVGRPLGSLKDGRLDFKIQLLTKIEWLEKARLKANRKSKSLNAYINDLIVKDIKRKKRNNRATAKKISKPKTLFQRLKLVR